MRLEAQPERPNRTALHATHADLADQAQPTNCASISYDDILYLWHQIHNTLHVYLGPCREVRSGEGTERAGEGGRRRGTPGVRLDDLGGPVVEDPAAARPDHAFCHALPARVDLHATQVC